MSLGTSNPYHAVWPLVPGRPGLGTCLCGPEAGVFYDLVPIGGGHGGDDASLTRDFALPPKLLFLVGEFEEFVDSRWNDTPGAPEWVRTRVATQRIVKLFARDTGEGCAHLQVDTKYAESAGFTGPPRRICCNWQPVGTGGNPPCEVFVFSAIGFPYAPTALVWSVAARTINGTPFAAESVSSPAHKLGIGGVDWKGEDDFQAGWTSFRYPGYGTPGSAHALQCTRESFSAGRRGADRELFFVDGFGGGLAGVHLYSGAGVVAYNGPASGQLYTIKPLPTEDLWMAGGGGPLFTLSPPYGTSEISKITTPPSAYIAPQWAGYPNGGLARTTDLFVFRSATNAGPGYVAGNLAAVRFHYGSYGQSFDWTGAGDATQKGGLTLDAGGVALGGQAWNQKQSAVGGTAIFDCDADGRLYYGLNVEELAGSPVSSNQLFRVDCLGTNPTQIGTFWKSGSAGYVFGCVVMADPAYGGAGVSHAVVVGDFDAYTPPVGASSTAMVSGLNGVTVLSLRDSQVIDQQNYWPGRFRAGATTVNTGDWLPGLILPA